MVRHKENAESMELELLQQMVNHSQMFINQSNSFHAKKLAAMIHNVLHSTSTLPAWPQEQDIAGYNMTRISQLMVKAQQNVMSKIHRFQNMLKLRVNAELLELEKFQSVHTVEELQLLNNNVKTNVIQTTNALVTISTLTDTIKERVLVGSKLMLTLQEMVK
jgi:hypothetical protein